jgi:hypothetical protein
MLPIDKAPESIEEHDLQQFVQFQVQEGDRLEYKRDMLERCNTSQTGMDRTIGTPNRWSGVRIPPFLPYDGWRHDCLLPERQL